jgi:hypothetical protein
MGAGIAGGGSGCGGAIVGADAVGHAGLDCMGLTKGGRWAIARSRLRLGLILWYC